MSLLIQKSKSLHSGKSKNSEIYINLLQNATTSWVDFSFQLPQPGAIMSPALDRSMDPYDKQSFNQMYYHRNKGTSFAILYLPWPNQLFNMPIVSDSV